MDVLQREVEKGGREINGGIETCPSSGLWTDVIWANRKYFNRGSQLGKFGRKLGLEVSFTN